MTLWTTCKCASWSPPKLTSSLQLKHFMSSVMENLSATMVVEEGELGGAVALVEAAARLRTIANRQLN